MTTLDVRIFRCIGGIGESGPDDDCGAVGSDACGGEESYEDEVSGRRYVHSDSAPTATSTQRRSADKSNAAIRLAHTLGQLVVELGDHRVCTALHQLGPTEAVDLITGEPEPAIFGDHLAIEGRARWHDPREVTRKL